MKCTNDRTPTKTIKGRKMKHSQKRNPHQYKTWMLASVGSLLALEWKCPVFLGSWTRRWGIPLKRRKWSCFLRRTIWPFFSRGCLRERKYEEDNEQEEWENGKKRDWEFEMLLLLYSVCCMSRRRDFENLRCNDWVARRQMKSMGFKTCDSKEMRENEWEWWMMISTFFFFFLFLVYF